MPAISRAAIVIDGQTEDWASISSLPISSQGQAHESPLGSIRAIKVATDDDFVFALIQFDAPRPFDPATRQARLVPGAWDDFSYFEIDVNGDGQWDYRTKMTAGKRYGLNNLAILRSAGTGQEGRIVLHGEGRKDYVPLGPRAFFTPDGQAVEMRIPRVPLRLTRGQILFRARVHYRDARGGPSRWATDYLPAGGQWVGLNLNAVEARTSTAGPEAAAPSPSRDIEPVMLRDEVGFVDADRKYASPYIVPRVSDLPPIGQRAPKTEDEEPPVATTTIPILVVDPQGPGQAPAPIGQPLEEN